MHIKEIRIAGFKSFVDPTDFPVLPGLTGIVGPNGCGKSNLLEALRWAMGASSARAMRGGEMDDLIFSGSEDRPARELAEVTLVLDNAERNAPPAFNDADLLEITRRLKRGVGSTYKLNGRTVRGKDIQLIFADASTGANSPSLVRQGQISELIASKPQNRRRILEEAAGIAGLNTRRHEAELKLRGAETNLERLSEVSAEVERQLESLKRQARKARKYQALSEELAALDALAAHLKWSDAVARDGEARTVLDEAKRAVEDLSRAAAEAETNALKARDAIQPLREAEAVEAAKVGQAKIALARVETQRRSASEGLTRLENDVERITADLEAEREQADDAAGTVQTLGDRLSDLPEPDPEREQAEADNARGRVEHAHRQVSEAESGLEAAQAALAEAKARLQAASSQRAAVERRHRQAQAEFDKLSAVVAALPDPSGLSDMVTALSAEAEDKLAARDDVRAKIESAEIEAADATDALEAARQGEAEAKQALGELEAEAKGLERLLRQADTSDAIPVADEIRIAAGYEAAVAAALGDDIKAPRDRTHPLYWDEGATHTAADLPAGATPLSDLVKAPNALMPRLEHCGVVDPEDGPELRSALKVGQRLVSREGHLWRWDGFTRTPDAPLSEAERLRQKARLEALTPQLDAARTTYEAAKAKAEAARTTATDAADSLKTLRKWLPDLDRAVSEVREAKMRAEQAVETAELKRGNAVEAFSAAEAMLGETTAEYEALGGGDLPEDDLDTLQAELETARQALADARREESEAKSALQDLLRAHEQLAGKRRGISRDLEDWTRRKSRAEARLQELQTRFEDTKKALEGAERPDALIEEADRLSQEVEQVDAKRKAAADELAIAEKTLSDAEKSARDASAASAEAREALAAARVAVENAGARKQELDESIRSQFQRTPDGLLPLAEAGLDAEDIETLDLREAERRADQVRLQRDQLGGVNLEAEAEAEALAERLGGQLSEREDLEQAIAKLREGVSALNDEGRGRLLAAFDMVNEHFKALFTTLFRGGQAELRLVDADDPLAAGLEIMAQPPGKRLGTLSLMSGGEQALTAAALIFAVFLSNPSPICVLDEVDAPLDDANVDRFCHMLDEMRRRTDTRFIVITHNPVTMSRVDRLFGVTMREKGVSKLVSVDLQTAENLVAAE